jgi:hypothetical protein
VKRDQRRAERAQPGIIFHEGMQISDDDQDVVVGEAVDGCAAMRP